MNLVEMPESCQVPWELFKELSATRQSGYAVNPISYSEIYFLCKLRGIELLTWELDLIRRFDNIVLENSTKETTSP